MARSTESFEIFVASEGPGLVRLARMLSGDARLAEDMVQETLLKTHRRWGAVSAAQNPSAYVSRVLVNEYVGWRRRRSNSEIAATIPDQSAPEMLGELDARDLVWRAMARLPRRQRAVLILRYYRAVPDTEIADLLGCTQGTVRSLASRAFARLRQDPDLAAVDDRPPSHSTRRISGSS